MRIQELRLIDLVLENKSWDLLVEADILDSDFQSREAKSAISFTRKYFMEYGSFPPTDIVLSEAGIQEFPSKVEPKFAVDNYKKFLMGHKAKDILTRAAAAINKDNDPEKSLAVMSESIQVKRPGRVASFVQSGELRIEDARHSNIGGVTGITTPWEYLSRAINVWEESTFNVMAGETGCGKSWLCCEIANYVAFKLNKQVLFVSPENDTDSILRRLDSLRYKIPFADRRGGNMDFRLYESYKERVRSEMGESDSLGDIWIADKNKVRSVSDITSIMSMKPFDLILVDGAYLLQPSRSGKDSYNSTETLIKDYVYATSLSPAPWLCVVQLNPSVVKSKDSKGMGYGVRGNKSWFIDAHTFVGVTQTIEERAMRRLKMTISKIRESGGEENILNDFYINSDKMKMDFTQIPEDEDFVQEDILINTL